MATTEEIERRVAEADAARSGKRAAAAKRVGELAQLRAEAAGKLAEIERELGDVLAESSDVIAVEELAKFTEVPVTDLNQLLNGRKMTRPKRKRSSTAKGNASPVPSTARTTSPDQAPAQPELAAPRTIGDVSTRIPVSVT